MRAMVLRAARSALEYASLHDPRLPDGFSDVELAPWLCAGLIGVGVSAGASERSPDCAARGHAQRRSGVDDGLTIHNEQGALA